MYPEHIDLMRTALDSIAKALPLVPDSKEYWRNEAGYAHERLVALTESLEDGRERCCQYAASAPQLATIKRFADALPPEMFETEPPTMMHRPPAQEVDE